MDDQRTDREGGSRLRFPAYWLLLAASALLLLFWLIAWSAKSVKMETLGGPTRIERRTQQQSK